MTDTSSFTALREKVRALIARRKEVQAALEKVEAKENAARKELEASCDHSRIVRSPGEESAGFHGDALEVGPERRMCKKCGLERVEGHPDAQGNRFGPLKDKGYVGHHRDFPRFRDLPD
jgi:hypothetical protein